MSEATAFDRVRRALEDLGPVKARGDDLTACCPAHEDRSPSLSVKGIDGQVLVYCHAGCETADVVAGLGLSMADLFDNPKGITYRYDNGREVFRTPDKRFRQAHTDNPPELYRLAEVRAAVAAGTTVYVCEGEKDCDAARSAGLTATCCPMGAGKWSKIDPSPLYGGHVTVIADDDTPGLRHAAEVAASLEGRCTVAVVRAAEGKDLADHIAAGHTVDELVPVPPEDMPIPSPQPRRLVLTPASTIPLRAPRWLWDTGADPGGRHCEGRIPAGSLTIAAGRAGIGKSQHAAWLAARLTTGTLPGCHHGTPRSVIYAASEDSWSMTIAPRLVAARADLSRVYRIDVHDDADPHARLTLPTDTQLLEQAIRDNNVAMMVLDPLLSLLDAGINDYRAREVRDALEPLLPIADRTGCALFGLAHFTKAIGSDPLLLIAGSGAFGQLVRAGIGYVRDDTGDDEDGPRYVMSTIKSNLGREDLPSLAYSIVPAEVDTDDGPAWVSRLEFTGTADRSVKDLLRDGNLDEDQRSERDEAADFIRGYLGDAGGTAPSNEVLKAGRSAGFGNNTLKKARSRAGARTIRQGFGRGGSWVWTLETDHRGHIDDLGATHTGTEPMDSMAAPTEDRPPGTFHEDSEGSTPTYVESTEPSVKPSEPEPPPRTSTCQECGTEIPRHHALCPDCTARLMATARAET